MCFITAGMGGGTGTGAAPIIAQAARELGVLTVGVVTKPFQFEGAKRMRQAEAGVEALQKVVDTLIIIPNQNLFRLANEKTTFTEAFSLADDVLYQGVKGVTDLMVRPGLINLDFADVRSVMDEMGKAMMGTGEAEGEDRAVSAAEKAIANPLLDEISLRGAKGVLINITGGGDLTLFELDEAANRIREEVDAEANIIVGSTLDVEMGGWMRVSVVATGIDAVEPPEELPRPRRSKPAPHDGAEPHQSEHDAPSDYHAASEPKLGRHEMRTRDEQPQYEARSTVGQSAASEEAFEAPSVDRNSEQAADPYVLEEPTFNANEEAYDSEPESFVAPRPREPGTPSPETMTRLQEAVRNAPNRLQQSMSRVDDVPADTDRSRFGINSLINRMTGQPGDSAEKPVATRRHPTSQQAEPEFEPEPEQGVDPDQDRIEIPAFLRRQAN
jgi:cell division protein FtsZ